MVEPKDKSLLLKEEREEEDDIKIIKEGESCYCEPEDDCACQKGK